MKRLVVYTAVVLLGCFTSLLGTATAQAVQDVPCQLLKFRDGQTVTLHGQVISGPHDMLFSVLGCREVVVLLYAGEDGSGLQADALQRDKNLEDFRRYTTAVYKRTRKNPCMQCSKYQVQATLVGKLSIAPDPVPEGQWKDKLGMLHDSSGKVVGKAGFGHPPIYRYCLTIKSVSDVKAHEHPKPAVAKPGDGATLLHEAGHLRSSGDV